MLCFMFHCDQCMYLALCPLSPMSFAFPSVGQINASKLEVACAYLLENKPIIRYTYPYIQDGQYIQEKVHTLW
jgi:hypothetical protein